MASALTAGERVSLPFRRGLLYAAGDVGPSLTSLCLAFYWLYFLIEVAGLPAFQAGLVHGSGYLFSAVANLWAARWLDRRVPDAAGRGRLVARMGLAFAVAFALLWWPAPGAGVLWYLGLSWAFHLLFAFVYLAYLSLTAAVAESEAQRVELNGYRFGGTIAVSLAVLALHGATEGVWPTERRLLFLGVLVAALAALGSGASGLGLARLLPDAPVGQEATGLVGWRVLVRSRVLWWAGGGNLAVWFAVQTTLVLTVFLCASAGVNDGFVLLAMQLSILVAAGATGPLVRRLRPSAVLSGASLVWCAGAALWWGGASPAGAAVLLGLGLGTGTVLSWARLPEALDRFAAGAATRVDARVYAGVTVLRDLVSAVVPVLASLVLEGREIGSPEAGRAAAVALILSAVGSALLLRALPEPEPRRPPPSGAGRGLATTRGG